MEGKRLKQIVKQLKVALEKWDYNTAIKKSFDEAQTRDFLIHDFFEKILNYSKTAIGGLQKLYFTIKR